MMYSGQRIQSAMLVVTAAAIPEHVLGLFWDADQSKLDVRRPARYIICRVLDYGDSPEVRWLLAI
ncbi:hypothetical protein FJY70_01530 [candidate division WOR-3 bacterium]|nr:hypothetical protein [candidate division WOR-3 bacterium]